MNIRFKHLSAPLLVQFEITYQCNNSCEFCYNFNREKPGKNPPNEASLNEKKALLEELAFLEVYSITFTGGEPFMDPHLIDLIRFAKNLGFAININTNGSLIDNVAANLLKKNDIDGVMVSLQSSCPEEHDKQTKNKGSWENTINGIKNLIKHKINVSINMTLTKQNFRFVCGVGELAAKLGIPFSLSRFIPLSKQDAFFEISNLELKKVMNDLEKNKKLYSKEPRIITPIPFCSTYNTSQGFPDARCTAGIIWCAISPCLEVRPCTFISDVIGDLRHNKFIDIWNSEKMRSWQNISINKRDCLHCEAVQFCLGGCRQVNKIHGKDPLMVGAIKLEDIKSIFHKLPNIELDTVFSKYPNISLRLEEFGGILITSSSKFVTLDGNTSIFIWKQIDGKKDVKSILSNLEKKYDISPKKEIEKDLTIFLRDLYTHGLIKNNQN